jgi:predicted Rossmann fold nucleotide-binding protein DprA/Smf involved in DNA uptake
VLSGAGERNLLSAESIAVVGSRDASPEALSFAAELGRAVASGGLAVASGGARGVDAEALTGALSAGGPSVAIIAEQLERRVREPSTRAALSDGFLALASPYAPGAGFTVRGAMGRKQIVYGMASAAVVVTAKEGTGGTWAGAVESLRGGMIPLFVRGPVDTGSQPPVKFGAQVLPWTQVPPRLELEDLLRELRPGMAAGPKQDTLFGLPEPLAKASSKRGSRSRRAPGDEPGGTAAT